MTTNKMANLGMLMPGIIHSVNNPMSLVFGNLEILKGNFKNFDPKKFRDEEEGKEFIEEGLGILSGLEKGSNRVIDVIKGVRNYIVGSDEGRIDTIPLIEVIDTVLIKCKYLLKNKIEIENKVNPSIQLKCNPRQVEQLLINILINCEENLYGNFDGHIHLMAKEEKNYILITIEDNGNILEGCQRIEKFYHFNEVAGRKDRSGLTLSCASLIAELNNGSFEIENNPNQGMSFYIVLPKE
jgi:K+-sensing histidine kinase KdpD